jgi:CRP-like cAMP-binding protein
MGLVELLTMTLVATVLHERALTLDPPHYRLRHTVSPLPSPDRRLGMRTAPARPDTRRPDGAARSEEDVLSTFPGHDVAVVRDTLAAAPLQTFPAGTAIVREGEEADAFYLVETGRVEVTRRDGAGTQHLGALAEGEWFGEAGLLLNAPRNATVTAGPGGAAVRVVGRQAFLALVEASDLVADEIGRLLRKRLAEARLRQALPLLGDRAADRLLPDFTPRTCPAGTPVVSEGEPADEFFVVVRGEAVVTRRDPSGTSVAVARLGPGDYFGEAGLLYGAPRNATVAASDGQDLEVLVTGRDGFDRLIAEGGGRRGELATGMLARLNRLA